MVANIPPRQQPFPHAGLVPLGMFQLPMNAMRPGIVSRPLPLMDMNGASRGNAPNGRGAMNPSFQVPAEETAIRSPDEK